MNLGCRCPDVVLGLAMTWSMFAVGWINAGDFNRSAGHFQRGYAPVHPPFNVWTESPNGGGTVNFITGYALLRVATPHLIRADSSSGSESNSACTSIVAVVN